LDFDLMVTEVAPADLLLQRAGRLHRHRRPRPHGLERPAFWLLEPNAGADGVPDFKATEAVYARHVLLRSYLALRTSVAVRLPEDLEPLVETVYAEATPAAGDAAWDRALVESFVAMSDQQKAYRQQARGVIVPSPHCEDDILEDFYRQLDDDDDNPEIHPTLRAATRLTEPTVSVVCLYRAGGRVYLDPSGTEPVDLVAEPTLPQAKRMLLNAVTLSHPGCVGYLMRQDPPDAWRESGLLRYSRPVVLDNAGEAQIGTYTLRVNGELGVRVEKSAGDGGSR